MKQKVYLFDFDGTITTKDTFVALILYAVGTWKCLVGFALYSPLLLLMKLHLYPNWKAKQRVFSHFFKGKSLEDFNKLCRNFAANNRSLLRSEAMKAIDEARNQGEVYVVSASVDNWVQPFLPHVVVVGTQLEVADGLLTGRFSTRNCYGVEKVNRVKQLLTAPRSQYYVIAFGDSRGDNEMLNYADEAHYQPFKS